MKYLPTLNLRNNGIHTAVITGQLRLLPGQRIQCVEGKRSRFISVNNGVINAVHWSGSGKATRSKFLLRARLNRLDVQRVAGTIDKRTAWVTARELIACS